MKSFWKNKNPFVFVRFGSLNLKKQKFFSENTFHSPPVKYGFYAMPFILQEWFLIGSLAKTQTEVFKTEIEISMEDFYKLSKEERKIHDKKCIKIQDQNRKIKSQIRKVFIKETGFIWHHLEDFVHGLKIVNRNKDWVKTSMLDWEIAVRKSTLKERVLSSENGNLSEIARSKINGYYSRDHYEIFIDEKV